MQVALLIASLLHVFEEFVYPGGFASKFKSMMSKIGKTISTTWLIITNLMFLLAVSSVLFIQNKLYIMSIVSIVFLNACLHIGKSIHAKGYFPGLFTALFLYIPIYILGIIYTHLNFSQVMICLSVGALLHSFPFLILWYFNPGSKRH